MDIAVAGQQLEIGEAFKTHARSGLEALKDKYFARAISAQTVLSPGPRGNGFRCEIVMHVRRNVILKAGGAAGQAQQAFDAALERIDKQLRRYVRRLRDHGDAGLPEPADFDASYRIFEPLDDNAPAAAEPAEPEADAPVIVAESRVDVPTATVADAVMMLDLRNTGALLFKNKQTGAFNMVYRREDGNIGWVEPAASR